MKRFLVILACLCLAGCLSSTISRGVDENRKAYFSSSNPDILIQLPSYFTYKKSDDPANTMDHMFYHDDTAVFIELVHHDPNENQIDYFNHPEFWMFDHVSLDGKINQGPIRILDEEWYFCNSVRRSEDTCFFVRELGYFADNHNIFLIRFVRVIPETMFDQLKKANHSAESSNAGVKALVDDLEKNVVLTRYCRDKR